ncbi:hypothetical protein J4Q44_G00103820 [Coregonus suidteri]|uniref:Uncharacterized protein n=1 Tax=Coregonus suidteri TaxID=861788 RepID=A0AAN8MRG4_9TELE
MALVDLIMWVVISALQDLSGSLQITDAFNDMKQLQIIFSRPVGVRIMRSILDDLLSVAGGPTALRKALTSGDSEVFRTVMTAVTLSVCQLVTCNCVTGPSSCVNFCFIQNYESYLDSKSPLLHGEFLVIGSTTMHSIVTKLLGQKYSDAPSEDATLVLKDWPFLDDLENHLRVTLECLWPVKKQRPIST